MKRIVGWLLILVGAPLAVVFGLFTLFYLGRGPYGIIVALGFTAPLFLIGLTAALLGAYLKNRSNANGTALRSRKRSNITNNNASEQPKNTAYNPVTLEDVQTPKPDPFFDGLDQPASRILVGILFVLIYLLSSYSEVATPLTLLVLLACLLHRMTARERAVSAAALTFSSVRLAVQFAGPMGIWRHATPMAPVMPGDGVLFSPSWIPLFLATCLFFAPAGQSKTYRVVFWYSTVLLLSGLLPGLGYTVVCAVIHFTLFFAILTGLVLDLTSNLQLARPLTQPSNP